MIIRIIGLKGTFKTRITGLETTHILRNLLPESPNEPDSHG